MSREIPVDFSGLSRRLLATEYNSVCEHEPECYLWESQAGPVNVCKMADSHLIRALRFALRSYYDLEVAVDEASDLGMSGSDYEEAIGAFRDELGKRGLERYIREV